jgi:hypothetical protein
VDASSARLEAWSKVLRSGNEDAIDELRIDRLRVHVEAVRDNVALSIKRVLEPGSIREPGAAPEVVEWVAGTVRSIKPASQSVSERLDVRIYFEDERLGRSTKSIRLDSTAVSAGGLAPGVPVVIRVESRAIYWNITRIHRSTPHLAKPDDAQAMDE